MNHLKHFLALFLSILVLGISNYASAKGPFDKEWVQVEAFEKKGLWKSALDKTLEIGKKARAQNQEDELLKTLVYRARYAQRLEEFSETSNIDLVESELKISSFPAQAILQSMLAEMYLGYLHQHRWEMMDRANTEAKAGSPVTEWSIKQLEQKIFDLSRASLSEPIRLQQIKIDQWSAMIQPGANAFNKRPSLFDILAHRAIQNVQGLRDSGTEPVSASASEESLYLSSFREYVAHDFDPQKVRSSSRVFIHDSYRKLIAYHIMANNAEAVIDADLARLSMAYYESGSANKDQMYLSALGSLTDAYKNSPFSTEVVFTSASFLYSQGLQYQSYVSEDKRWYMKRAKEMLESALASYPKSKADTRMRQLLDQIAAKDIKLRAEEGIIPNTWFKVLLNYRNTGTVYLRIIANNRKDDVLVYGMGGNPIEEYVKTSVIREWTVELPIDGDFQSHSLEIPIKGLEAGEYILLASASSKFETSGNGIASIHINSSVLSYTARNMQDGRLEVMVLHRNTGRPLRKVEVEMFYVVYDPGMRAYKSVRGETYLTDNDGYLLLSSMQTGKEFYLIIKKDKSRLRTERILTYQFMAEKGKQVEKHWFFTDRAIYRPGQTVFFKAIAEKDSSGHHQLLIDKDIQIYLRDANYSIIDSLILKTNSFGSVNAFFNLPTSSINGQFHIQTEFGQVTFNVEAYKRPTFEVKADSLKGIAELNKAMTVVIQAAKYSGLPFGAAEYKWELSRRQNWDMPWYGRIMPNYDQGGIIAGGSGNTKEDGSFEIIFTPWSANANPEEGLSYNFELTVHVTDAAGETHSLIKNYTISKNGVQTNVGIRQKVNKDLPFAFELNAENAEGFEIPFTADVKVTKLKQPADLLRTRLWERPDKFMMTAQDHSKIFPNDIFDNEDDVRTYTATGTVWEGQINSAISNKALPGLQRSKLGADINPWTSGLYKVEAKGKTQSGKELKWEQVFTVYSAQERELAVKDYFWVELMTPRADVGDTAVFLVGTSDNDSQVYCEITCKAESINRKWILLNQEQRKVEIPVDHSMKGGFFLTLFMVKQNRIYQQLLDVEVPFSDKQLELEWSSFRDKMEPGKPESITITIKGLAEGETAEMLASMYDASLDAYTPHSWNISLYPANVRRLFWVGDDGFRAGMSALYQNNWNFIYTPKIPDPHIIYPSLLGSSAYHMGMGGFMVDEMSTGGARMKNAELAANAVQDSAAEDEGKESSVKASAPAEPGLRVNLQETAFFFPELYNDKKGNVTLKFNAPEAITRWKLMSLAHTKDLRYGMKEYILQTQKQLVIKPNLPRFLRQGDKITITASVSSVENIAMDGYAVLSLRNPATAESLDKLFGNIQNTKSFRLRGKDTQVISWEITVPAGIDEVAVRLMATSGKQSDGEESLLPVLVNRELLRESVRFYMTEPGTKSFSFEAMEKVLRGGGTAKAVAMNIEFDANPLWNIVKALPYLMEFPYECTEQEYSRFFANMLGAKIMRDNPAMAEVIKGWGNANMLSELEKNPELRTNQLENSPWVLAAESEKKQRSRVAMLMDAAKMKYEGEALAAKLVRTQLSNGGWSWFPGMADNEYITMHILSGLARMSDLGLLDGLSNASEIQNAMIRALSYMDARMVDKWRKIKKDKSDWYPGSYEISYMYCRAILNSSSPLSGNAAEAWADLVAACKKRWTGFDVDQQARLGSSFKLMRMQNEADAILSSLRETAIHSDELGTFWKHADGSRITGESIVEVQARIIQFFLDMGVKGVEIQEMRRRLMMDKQVNAWESTKATTEACFVMLDKNTSELNYSDETKLLVGGQQIKPDFRMAGTGFLSKSWTASELGAGMARIEVSKANSGLSWGAAYFQYTEEIDKAPASNSGMKLMRVILREREAGLWEELTAMNECKPGDRIKVRLIMNLDRDMEFLHLKDLRASGLEPGVALSGYRWDNGLGYYRNISDVSMDFFFDRLPSGTHVLEYDLFAAYSGDFSNGFSEIESMYAPAFRARTVGGRLRLK